MNAGKDVIERKTSIGRPLPILDVVIADADGKELPDGQLGELLIYGPTITPGYWNRPDATAETVRDGWLHTGDLGYRDPDGFYFVVDRAKDMIIRGGENVYCTEIENCLADHPEIDEAAVVGVPDAELGERVKAIVRRVPGSSLGEAAVRAHVAAHLASFKVPEFVEFTRRAAAAQCRWQAAQERAARARRGSVRHLAERIASAFTNSGTLAGERKIRPRFAKISIASRIHRSTLVFDGHGLRCKETEVSVPPPKSSGRKEP